jgi:hypothetical protein
MLAQPPFPKKKDVIYSLCSPVYTVYSFIPQKAASGFAFLLLLYCLCVYVCVPFCLNTAEQSTTVQRLIIGSKIYTIPGPVKEDELLLLLGKDGQIKD